MLSARVLVRGDFPSTSPISPREVVKDCADLLGLFAVVAHLPFDDGITMLFLHELFLYEGIQFAFFELLGRLYVPEDYSPYLHDGVHVCGLGFGRRLFARA